MKLSFFNKSSPKKKFTDMLNSYKKAVEQNPADIRIRVKIAELYLEHNKKEEAVQEYLQAARDYQEKRLFQIAIAIYNHIISITPEKVDVYSELSELHLKNGFIGDCVAILERLAKYYYDNDMKFEATNILKKIGKIDPDNKFFKIKITNFYESRDLSEAETLKEGPKDKWSLVENSNSETSSGTTSSSENFFDLEAALQDDVSINISDIPSEEDEEKTEHANTGMSPETVFKELQTIMESEPDKGSPQFHYNLGMAHIRCNQPEEACNKFQQALENDTNKAECYVRLAECNILLNRLDNAEDFVNKGLKLLSLNDNDKLELQYQKGLIYKANGNTKKAVKIFKQISEKNKNFKSVDQELKQLS